MAVAALILSAACTLAPAFAPPPMIPGSGGASARQALAPVLAVISWNLNAGRGDLAALTADLASGRLTGVPPREYVLLLQEASDPDGSLAATLGQVESRQLSAAFGPVRDLDGRARGNAILATVPLAGIRTIPLPRERQPRAAVVAEITIDGRTLFLVSVHLENRISWWRGGLFSDTARGRQATALVEALPPAADGILGGDLNTWLGPAEPAWRLLNQRFGDLPASSRDRTFQNRLPLDHVLFDLPQEWTAERRVLPNSYGSDHHPVLGVIRPRLPS